MRAHDAVAIVVLAVCLRAASARAEPLAHVLRLLGVPDDSPAHRLLTCSHALGPSKCLSALSVWRSQHAFETLQSGRGAQFDLRADVESFPWEHYSNVSDDQLHEQLTEGTEKLLRYRSLSLTLPGYSFELESRGNGTLNVDVYKNDEVAGRGMMKKYLKDFYAIVPFLMLPGLIMSAILPFVLPALKMMTVAVGMLNNMALSGAVFTLLRNNAFSDHYEKKVIYVNEGYKNEQFSPLMFKDLEIPLRVEYSGSASNVHPVVQEPPGGNKFPNFKDVSANDFGDFKDVADGNFGNFKDVSGVTGDNFANFKDVAGATGDNFANFKDVAGVSGDNFANFKDVSTDGFGDFKGVSGPGGNFMNLDNIDLNSVQNFPIPNAAWINQYYGNAEGVPALASPSPPANTKVRRSSKTKAKPF